MSRVVIIIVAFARVVGWISHLYGLNQSLENQAIRYHVIRMDFGRIHPKIAELDSLFSTEGSDYTICQKILAYEVVLICHTELQLKQQQLTKEQEALRHRL